MSETNKAERKPVAAKRKAAAQPQVVTIPCPETDDPDEAIRLLAKEVPGWDSLEKQEREELARLIRHYRARGAPAKVKMIRNRSQNE